MFSDMHKGPDIFAAGNAVGRRQFDAIRYDVSGEDSPPRSPGRRMPRRSAISRNLARLVAKNRPSSRPSRSLSIRICQFWALQPAARTSRPAPPKSSPCPGERVARCSPRVGRSSPAKTLASCPRGMNPSHGGLRSDRAKANLPAPPRHTSRQRCRLSLRPADGRILSLDMFQSPLNRSVIACLWSCRHLAATGFKSMYTDVAKRAASSRIAILLNRPSKKGLSQYR